MSTGANVTIEDQASSSARRNPDSVRLSDEDVRRIADTVLGIVQPAPNPITRAPTEGSGESGKCFTLHLSGHKELDFMNPCVFQKKKNAARTP